MAPATLLVAADKLNWCPNDDASGAKARSTGRAQHDSTRTAVARARLLIVDAGKHGNRRFFGRHTLIEI